MKLRLIPRDTGFHDLFARQAGIVAEAAVTLATELRDHHDPAAASTRLRELEHDGDDLNHEVMARLAGTFVAPFDRHAIHDLASGLDDVLDLIEEVADELVLYQLTAAPAGAADQAGLLSRACAEIVEAIDHLERPTELRPYAEEIHRIEKDGDALVRRLIQRLFDGTTDVRPVLIGHEVYQGLEAALDRADRVGRVLDRLALSYGPGPYW